jgi:hypothetical protein
MSIREHLRKLLPHAEWRLVEVVLGSAMLTAAVQWVEGALLRWWVLGVVFFGWFCVFSVVHGFMFSRRYPRAKDMQKVLQSLIEKRQWAVDHLQNAPVQSYLELRRWEEKRGVWREEVIELLQREGMCSPDEVARFAMRGLYRVENHEQTVVDHNDNLNQLTKDLKVLLDIIDRLEERLVSYHPQ